MSKNWLLFGLVLLAAVAHAADEQSGVLKPVQLENPPESLVLLRLSFPSLTLAENIIHNHGGKLVARFAVEGLNLRVAAGLLTDAGFKAVYPNEGAVVLSPPSANYATEERVFGIQAQIKALAAEKQRLEQDIAVLRKERQRLNQDAKSATILP